MNEDNTIDYAISVIRRFLSERPDSADTLDGIHRWWIRWPRLEESSLVTLAALERLESVGEMEQIKVGSSMIWRRKK
jgi:hypothetical protein